MSAKEQQALRTVRNYMWWSMGAGLIPVPFVDLVAVSGVELKMLADLSKIYEIPFEQSRGKAIIGSLIGFVVPHAMSTGAIASMIKAIPVAGALAGAPSMVLFCGASAWALGKVFIQHFESGGTFLDFDADKVKEYFKAQYEEGQAVALKLEAEKKAEPVEVVV